MVWLKVIWFNPALGKPHLACFFTLLAWLNALNEPQKTVNDGIVKCLLTIFSIKVIFSFKYQLNDYFNPHTLDLIVHKILQMRVRFLPIFEPKPQSHGNNLELSKVLQRSFQIFLPENEPHASHLPGQQDSGLWEWEFW